MATDKIRVTAVIDAPAMRIYDAWLSSREHTAFTKAKATVEPKVGGRHTAHDGYIHGWNLVLEPGKRIVQSWRTTEFAPEDPDSWLELRFARAKGGTRVTLVQRDIPAGQGAQYESGWAEHYFEPMKQYFATRARR